MKNSTAKLWQGALAILILFFLVAVGSAAAADGEIWINTTGIKAVPGQTVEVPVMITTSGEPLYNADLEITCPTNNAVVKANQSSIKALGGMRYFDDETGLFSGLGFTIKGTNQVFFYLVVTPDQNTVDDVALNITIINAGEGTLETMKLKNYQATNATLNLYRGLTFTITASAGDHGSISPGTVHVIEDESQTFTITPNTGYKIADVLVDGNSVGAVDTYTFNNVNKDYTIEAQFEPIQYTITWFDGDGNPLKTDSVPYGETPSYTGNTPTKTGDAQYSYVFNGSWTPAVTAVTDNAEYRANFDATVNQYNVTWINGDGSVIKTEKIDYGTVPQYTGDTPTKQGDAQYTYTFKDWDKPVEPVTGDATYTAVFDLTVNEYTITWKVDGSADKVEQVPYGTTPNYGSTPTKQGDAQYSYTFKDWDKELVPVTGDATYTAVFAQTVNEYTITWKVDGSADKVEQVPYGETPSYGAAPTKDADDQYTYTFKDWDKELVPVTGDATYTAVFDLTVNEYTITWKVDGLADKVEQVPYGTTPDYGATPTKAADVQYSYTFKDWDKEIVPVTGDATYTAVFDQTVNEYTITWKVDGSADKVEQVPYGETPSYGATPTKQGDAQYSYTFKEWDKELVPVTGDETYTAVFDLTVNEYTITWKVDGSADKVEQVPYGTTPDYGATPTKAADVQYTYTFKDWDKPVVPVTGDATYTAVFDLTVNEYTITWKVDGSADKVEQVPYGETPSYGATPTKAADVQYSYTFKDWDKEIVPVTGDATYTAVFDLTVNEYTITWKVDGSEDKVEQVPYGTTPDYGSTPTKQGDAQYSYTFKDWDKELVPVTGDATYTAVFDQTVNEYTITWKVDGSADKVEQVPYGDTPSYGATPTKAADVQYSYTFKEWTPAIESVSKDATYTAVFDSVLNNYTVVWKNHDGTVLETDNKVDYGTTPEYNGATPTRDADARYTYTFKDWTPAISAVTGNTEYTATFTETLRTYDITVTPTVNGTVNVPTQATVDDIVTITIEPEDGFELDTITVTTENGEPVTLTGYTFQMPTSNVTVSASFKHINYTVDKTGVLNGTVTSSHETAHKGETVTLTLAELHAGHIFNNFVVVNESGNTVPVTITGSTTATFVMPANHVSVSLNVTKIDYTITVTPSVNGTAAAPATAQVGDKVTVTVTPESGYQFSRLNVTSETGQTIAATGKTFVMPAENVIVNAEFSKIPPSPSGGGSSGSSVWLQPTQVPTVTPTATPTSTPSETVPTTVPTTEVSETHVADINNDGSADFAQSQIIFSVTLPEDHPGTVELTTNIDTADIVALAGKEIYHAAEITLDHPLAEGETATVHFMIPIAELERRGLTAADVCLYHHDHDGLTALPTVYEIIGNTVYYESTATEFSPFIIVFEENGATPSTEPVKTPVPTTPESPSPLLAVLAVLGVLAVLIIIIIIVKRRRDDEE